MDAIFCLAVFQNAENRHTLSEQNISYYEFSKFEDQLTTLDAKLKIGGLLFIDHCDFNFLDTHVSQKYQILDVSNNQIKRSRPLFNNKNIKVTNENNNYRVFRKLN